MVGLRLFGKEGSGTPVFKILVRALHFSFSVLKYNNGNQAWNSQIACQNSKQGRPLTDCFFRSSLIWVCPICISLFYRQLVFEIRTFTVIWYLPV